MPFAEIKDGYEYDESGNLKIPASDIFIKPIITTINTNPDLLPEREDGGRDWNQYVPIKIEQ